MNCLRERSASWRSSVDGRDPGPGMVRFGMKASAVVIFSRQSMPRSVRGTANRSCRKRTRCRIRVAESSVQRDRRVVRDDILRCAAGGEVVEHDCHEDAGACDARLAVAHRRIERDALPPVDRGRIRVLGHGLHAKRRCRPVHPSPRAPHPQPPPSSPSAIASIRSRIATSSRQRSGMPSAP